MMEKILFVDDEPAALDGYKRMLHRDFEVHTAIGGDQGLAAIHECGPYCVVISDMRMPGMSGAQFLSQVRQEAPNTVRMLLTGFADMTSAMDAVNEGNIFRFLTKPCEKDVMSKAITSGLVQYRLITAERDLLENTLMGSIKVLTDVLGAVSPEAFGRSVRITRCVRHLVEKLGLDAPWRFEAAAMLSQLGCIALEPELMQDAYMGTEMTPEDQARFARHPQLARELLVNIPRLEPIAWMISQQLAKDPSQHVPQLPTLPQDTILLGAKLLKLAIAFDNFKMQGLSDDEVVERLRARSAEYGRVVVDALAGIKTENSGMELRKISTAKLAAGMVLQQELRNKAGILVVAKGQEITRALLIKLQNFVRLGTIDKETMALVPV